MSSRPRSPQSERKSSRRRTGRGAGSRVNRSQQRAMEIRAAATRSRELHASDSGAVVESPTSVASAGAILAAGTKRARRPTARAAVMNREEEYRYIRQDMMRLVLTASVLLVLMLVVLFVVEA